MQLFINNWSAVLTAPATASAVSLSVPLADAAKLTGLGGGDHYLLTLAELDGNGVETAWEIVKVTGSASGVLTVLRDQEGTGARDWASASAISARVTKGALEALRAGTGTAVGDDMPLALGVASPGSSEAASRQDHVHAKPTAADIGAATTAQGAKADTAVQPAALASGLAFKVDKDGTKVLSDQNYTSAEKAKLAGLEGAHFKGLHASLAALQAAHPSAAAGDYADVDSGTGADVARFIWDVSDSTWIIQSGASGSMTAAQIKTAYESNPDTNGYSDAEKAKLGAIAAGATANAADAQLRDRSTHTGTQTASTISDLAAAVRGVIMTGVTFATATAGLATDSLLVFIGKLQAQINGLATAVAGKQEALVSGTNIKTVNGASLLGAGDIAVQKYRGLYVSLSALNAAVPTASAGDYADVDSGSGSNVKRYIWDTSDTAWVEQTGGGTGMANPMTTAGDMIVGGAAGVPARLPVGATGKVLGVASGAPAWVDPPAAAGGLVNFTESKVVAAPNATVPVVQLAVSVSEANGDASVTPKGTGAFTLHVPDGATAGGAKRGSYSVDLSLARTNSVQVASGAYSAVLGGEALRASANYSVSLGGRSNTASGTHSAALAGDTCTVSGQYAVTLGGQSNTASGTHSACLGGSSLTVSGTYAVGSGLGCVANGVSSYAQGAYASARQVQGSFAFSAGRFGTTGDAQTMSLQLRQQTSNATTVRLTSNAAAAAAANQMVLPSSAAFGYRGQVVAIDTAGNTSAWRIDGLAKSNSGGTVSLVGTPSVSLIAQDASAASWAVAVAVDSTNRCLAVDVTGAASTTIRWLCNLETVQLVF